ncbi:MAG: hypothetical protein RIU71_371 [Pseudomonadota bacterium]
MKELPSPTFTLSLISLPSGSLHQSSPAQTAHPTKSICALPVQVTWAKHQDEVREAQQLRYRQHCESV